MSKIVLANFNIEEKKKAEFIRLCKKRHSDMGKTLNTYIDSYIKRYRDGS